MHVGFMQIFLPQFLIDGLVDVLVFEVGHICVPIGTIDACVRDDFWHIWVKEGLWCIGHDIWLTAIAVGHPNILFRIIHCPGELL